MDCEATWRPGPSPPDLNGGAVHLWRAWLDQPAERVAQFAHTLSEGERLRAQKFHFDTDRVRFTVGRGLLRALVGLYLDVQPQQVRFDYGDWGKPQLAYPTHRPLYFNLAHAEGLALFAFARDRHVGVDIEFARLLPDMEHLVTQFFSEREKDSWLALPSDERPNAFYHAWTRKEAYLKALGSGLARPTTQFTVSLAPGEPARLMEVNWDPAEVNRWTLVSLEPTPGYIAALAVEGHDWRLDCWSYKQTPGFFEKPGVS